MKISMIMKKIRKYKFIVPLLVQMKRKDRNNLIKGFLARSKYYKSPLPDLEVDLKSTVFCAECPNMCRFDCPALLVTRRETFAPAQKARIAYFMAMNHIPFTTPGAIDALYACMKCDACREWCPWDISTGDFLVQMRQALELRQLLPEGLTHLSDNGVRTGSIFDQTPFVSRSPFDINDPDPEIFYFIGCMDLKYRPDAVRATIALLRHLNIRFCTRLGDRQCCTGPMYKAGFRTLASKLAEKNATLINQSGVKQILFTCPGCMTALHEIYPDLGFSITPSLTHAISFFWEKIQQQHLKLTHPLVKSVTYHDPCLLSRSSSVVNLINETRSILIQIPSLTIKEPYLHGTETRCCGMGGAYMVSNPENAQKVHQMRYDQLIQYQPDILVSGCPTCEYALDQAQKADLTQSTHGVRPIMDIVELIADAAGIKY